MQACLKHTKQLPEQEEGRSTSVGLPLFYCLVQMRAQETFALHSSMSLVCPFVLCSAKWMDI